jgi:dTDP-4-amino-4,6-dideoxygalactose transaminase
MSGPDRERTFRGNPSAPDDVNVRVPFNQHTRAAAQLGYVAQSLNSQTTSGDGPYTARCQELLEQVLGAERVMLTPSCTAALELCAMALDVKPGDEVIVPSFTFVSTASAFCLRGATVKFADVDPDTCNLAPSSVAHLVTERTRVIVPVHYAGVAVDMDEICELAAGVGAAVVEDNAHGIFGTYREAPLGTIGALGTLSFHDTKNLTCGEGGALIVNDASLVERCEILREKGTNRSSFFRGEIDKYTWVDTGSSFLLSDILAAVLVAQLEESGRIQAARANVWHVYDDALRDWCARSGVRQPVVPSHSKQSFHMYYLLMNDHDERAAFIAHLRRRGVEAAFHYLPLHLTPVGRRLGGVQGQCPVTEDISARLVRLPFFSDMSSRDQAYAIEGILDFRP